MCRGQDIFHQLCAPERALPAPGGGTRRVKTHWHLRRAIAAAVFPDAQQRAFLPERGVPFHYDRGSRAGFRPHVVLGNVESKDPACTCPVCQTAAAPAPVAASTVSVAKPGPLALPEAARGKAGQGERDHKRVRQGGAPARFFPSPATATTAGGRTATPLSARSAPGQRRDGGGASFGVPTDGHGSPGTTSTHGDYSSSSLHSPPRAVAVHAPFALRATPTAAATTLAPAAAVAPVEESATRQRAVPRLTVAAAPALDPCAWHNYPALPPSLVLVNPVRGRVRVFGCGGFVCLFVWVSWSFVVCLPTVGGSLTAVRACRVSFQCTARSSSSSRAPCPCPCPSLAAARTG